MSRRTSACWSLAGNALAFLAVGLFSAAAQADGLKYPPAARGNVVEDYHGTAVADPYRWMEELDSPATRAWVGAEGKLTDDYLAGISERGALRTRIAALYEYEKYGLPFKEGGRYYYTRNSGHQDQSVLYTTRRLEDPATVALDPNALSASVKLIVTGYAPARDGRHLAYGVSEAGSDWVEWRVRDLDAGKDLPDVARHTKYYEPAFAHDSKGFYYSAFPAPQAGKELSTQDAGDAVYYHALGTPATTDRLIFSVPAHPDWQYEPHLSTDGRWLVIAAGEGEVGDKGLENIYFVDLSAQPLKALPVTSGFEAAYIYVGADAGKLYFLTTLDAPNGRIIGIDPLQPEPAHWQNVIANSADAIDLTQTSVTLVDHQLIVRTLHDARSRVLVYGLDGALHREVKLPGPGYRHRFRRPPTGHRGVLSLQRSHHAHDHVPLRPEVRRQHGVPRTAGGV